MLKQKPATNGHLVFEINCNRVITAWGGESPPEAVMWRQGAAALTLWLQLILKDN
jgi:hypothetical protein